MATPTKYQIVSKLSAVDSKSFQPLTYFLLECEGTYNFVAMPLKTQEVLQTDGLLDIESNEIGTYLVVNPTLLSNYEVDTSFDVNRYIKPKISKNFYVDTSGDLIYTILGLSNIYKEAASLMWSDKMTVDFFYPDQAELDTYNPEDWDENHTVTVETDDYVVSNTIFSQILHNKIASPKVTIRDLYIIRHQTKYGLPRIAHRLRFRVDSGCIKGKQ